MSTLPAYTIDKRHVDHETGLRMLSLLAEQNQADTFIQSAVRNLLRAEDQAARDFWEAYYILPWLPVPTTDRVQELTSRQASFQALIESNQTPGQLRRRQMESLSTLLPHEFDINHGITMSLDSILVRSYTLGYYTSNSQSVFQVNPPHPDTQWRQEWRRATDEETTRRLLYHQPPWGIFSDHQRQLSAYRDDPDLGDRAHAQFYETVDSLTDQWATGSLYYFEGEWGVMNNAIQDLEQSLVNSRLWQEQEGTREEASQILLTGCQGVNEVLARLMTVDLPSSEAYIEGTTEE
ncbi:hypothetical protein TREMEDRAFT_60733 [Tremella mesenterica DSM 1558]|uniref:uncharacterized protein n=1 Tax=Tremella mesenterica (strain ATCC 24925 / CBS 8224 / DSM 1558 / NBRC 9311 / NRRL Y-6157 / RJB 2259-6 / UBC 559-6) TaxID=578456 RepID=UPI0003F49158|nr:uncharacterized protein TREMEDRAFT_60733 [Tremella mesenterica DSM 1558]EIW71816.1 hypothetical protein TREMEDRAFT_60733 [Tremella mesenterica DSM 1558]